MSDAESHWALPGVCWRTRLCIASQGRFTVDLHMENQLEERRSIVIPYKLDVHGIRWPIHEGQGLLEISQISSGWHNLYFGSSDSFGSKAKIVFSVELDVPIPPAPPVIDSDPPVKHERISDEGVRKRQELFSNWVCDFRLLLDNKKLSDCSIVVGDEVINAHRCVLAHYSEVFQEFFTCPLAQEAVDGIVRVSDFSPGSVRALVRYLYTGCIDSEAMKQFKMELFKLADKYLISTLKHYIANSLLGDVNAGNVLDMVVLADNHDAPALLKACAPVIQANSDKLFLSDEWMVLEKERPHLLIELLKLGASPLLS